MADQLLIRMFDVGLGDCVYCCIPDAHRDGGDFHILIDCGSLSGMEGLKRAVETLKPRLPDAGVRKRLDLLIVTHEHKDHMAGFGPSLWRDFAIGAIWMSAAMDPDHPEAAKAKALHGFATAFLARALRYDTALSPGLREFAEAMSFSNDEAMTMLRKTLPEANQIKPTYVHAGLKDPGATLPVKGATLKVLGPEQDIDFYYLGDEGDPSLRTMMGLLETQALVPADAPAAPEAPTPDNVDPGDFRRLRARMQSTALAFADLDGKVTNNTSVVLLIEWRGRRLLFVGDAEWDKGFRERKGNCAWNVMWHKRREALDAPVDFLKIGHHGSVNATPWGMGGRVEGSEPVAILDAILPVARKGMAKAVVSTQRSNYETIPRTDLLAELGRRVANTRNYADAFRDAKLDTAKVARFADYETASFDSPQPLRTDLERMLKDTGYLDVLIDPAPGWNDAARRPRGKTQKAGDRPVGRGRKTT